MNLEQLYDIAENENIKIYDYCIDEDINGIFLNYDKLNAIALNCDNSLQEKCVLSEELGHYYMDAYYTFNSSQIVIDKAEYRAKKWSYYVLIPFDNLRRAILNRN